MTMQIKHDVAKTNLPSAQNTFGTCGDCFFNTGLLTVETI